ncbi:carbohydrate-binding family 9-like protein [Flagellimonas algicola]|uniref:Carbohydrate-binding domain-containing protein n=1 Tax=Flagellimonas algicola TaxID=2583815 RepID=A0ABY2WHQ8_9FLAO|nr:carbohydrate-binding family 9-like protein [Allomuricauda algicola]TMU50700.1 hypothetical protein FGG15_18035 [Allomuricauda algicola]
MKTILLLFCSIQSTLDFQSMDASGTDQIIVHKTTDFTPTGDGKSQYWEKVPWTNIRQRSHLNTGMETKIKALYSDKGVYFLFHCQDTELNASFNKDGERLWLEDVFEIFIWPDPSQEIYFEYELSPLNYELPLMVIKFDGELHRWQVWYFEDRRKIIHKTTVQGGPKETNANILSWMGEIFIPFETLYPMSQKKPTPGTHWKANFTRMDYQNNKSIHWSWQELPNSFHEINKFGTILFQ